MAITSANQLELLQTAEAVAREKMIEPELTGDFQTLMAWADKVRRLGPDSIEPKRVKYKKFTR